MFQNTLSNWTKSSLKQFHRIPSRNCNRSLLLNKYQLAFPMVVYDGKPSSHTGTRTKHIHTLTRNRIIRSVGHDLQRIANNYPPIASGPNIGHPDLERLPVISIGPPTEPALPRASFNPIESNRGVQTASNTVT